MTSPDGSDRLVSLESTVYVVEEAKVLYVQVFKAACTTMLWTMAGLAGVERDQLPFSTGAYVSRDMVIHDRRIHPVPTIGEVSDALRHEALTSDEWMRLGVTRDPYARLYSGWESRILLLHKGPWSTYPQPPLVDDGRSLDVGASFRSFVASMEEHRGVWQGDFHFAQQVHLLALDEIDYTDLVTTKELSSLFVRLSDRVGHPVDPGRLNEGLGIAYTDVYDEETARRCEQLFDQDFDRLSFSHQSFRVPRPAILVGPAYNALQMVRGRNQRLQDLSNYIDSLS